MAAQLKEIRRAYGFDEVAIAPGELTVNPEMTSTEFTVGDITLSTPILAAAMDAVVSPTFASHMSELGGIAVMNLEGIQARYENTEDILNEVVTTPQEEVTALLQKLYTEPIKDHLIAARVEEIKKSGAKCAVSITPASTKRFAPVAAEAGADMIVVQSTVTTARHISSSQVGLRFPELLEMVDVPVLVGNCVGFDVALELMETGIHLSLIHI